MEIVRKDIENNSLLNIFIWLYNDLIIYYFVLKLYDYEELLLYIDELW